MQGNSMESTLNEDTIAALKEMDEPGESTFFDEIVDAYLEDSKARLVVVKATYAAANPTDFAKAAHAIKGSSLNMGAEKLAALMKNFEMMGKSGKLPETFEIENAEKEFEAVHKALAKIRQHG